MARFIPITWLVYIYSGLLWRAFEKGTANILKKLSDFCQEICLELIQHEVPEERGARVCSQLLGSATNKLNEMIAELKQLVTEKQREISRVITPHIQVCNNWSQRKREISRVITPHIQVCNNWSQRKREISRIITPHIQVCNNWSQRKREISRIITPHIQV